MPGRNGGRRMHRFKREHRAEVAVEAKCYGWGPLKWWGRPRAVVRIWDPEGTEYEPVYEYPLDRFIGVFATDVDIPAHMAHEFYINGMPASEHLP